MLNERKIKRYEYLFLLLIGSKDVKYLNSLSKDFHNGRLKKILNSLEKTLSRIEKEFNSKNDDKDNGNSVKFSQLLLLKSFKNFVRLFIVLFSLSMLFIKFKLKRLNFKNNLKEITKNCLRFSISVSTLLTINPVLKNIFNSLNLKFDSTSPNNPSLSSPSSSSSPSSLLFLINESIIPNFLTCFLSLIIYPNDKWSIYQRHYVSIWLLISSLDHCYKYFEFKCPSKKLSLLKSWYLLPICYSFIFESYILDESKCPEYFNSVLNNLTTGLLQRTPTSFASSSLYFKDMILRNDFNRNIKHITKLKSVDIKTVINPNYLNYFMKSYLPKKLKYLLKYILPITLFGNLKTYNADKDTASNFQILTNSIIQSVKLASVILSIVCTSVFLSLNLKYFDKVIGGLSLRNRLRIVGFVSGLISVVYSRRTIDEKKLVQDKVRATEDDVNEAVTETIPRSSVTYRSIWLYVLRLTLVSSTVKSSKSYKSFYKNKKIDKILMILSLMTLLNINDFYSLIDRIKFNDKRNSISSDKILMYFTKCINDGDLLSN
ncbi:hypothetical protein BVG19_g2738 [[Candida] boidinii]|nr:hypothetical protein BVG19_g2738 [[Candida] boidinii]OWB49224.1 hypothetical protein B5S27_g764 [[Candida] boidinii]